MKQKLRERGQCVQCGKRATHSHECAFCHVVTLSIVVIKGKYTASQLVKVTEGFCKKDLFKTIKDESEDPGVRHIAFVVVNLALAHGLRVYDVQSGITDRLRDVCKQINEQTEESRADYIRRVIDWMGTITAHMRKAGA